MTITEKTAKNRKNSPPQRTCVVCGAKRDKRRLIRFAAGGVLAVDSLQKLPGRGLYVCGSPECINKFRNHKTALRIFRGRKLPEDGLAAFADALTEACAYRGRGV